MDNAIRAALDTWLPLIKGLSFDERVGFLTWTQIEIIFETGGEPFFRPSINDNARLEILRKRDLIRTSLLEMQTEQLRQIPISPQQASTWQRVANTAPTVTLEQLINGLNKAIARGDWQSVTRIAKKLEKVKR